MDVEVSRKGMMGNDDGSDRDLTRVDVHCHHPGFKTVKHQ